MLINCLLVILFSLSGTWSRRDEDVSCLTEQCFHQPVEQCPPPESTCRCKVLSTCEKAVVCCNLNSFQLSESLSCGSLGKQSNIEALHIRNATLVKLDLNNKAWTPWRTLKYLSITNGKIGQVVGEFKKHQYISCLNLSSNGISKFQDRSLSNLFNLKFLDLSLNNLLEVPSFRISKNEITLDISDNKPLLCTSLATTLNNSELSFLNENNTFCKSPKSWIWFNSTEDVQLNQIILRNKFIKENICFQNCTCNVDRMFIVPGRPQGFAVMMECMDKGFISLPSPLPQNTYSLTVSNNNITSLRGISDKSYDNLKFLFADNNLITSIQPLEGTKFFSTFNELSLRNNKIKTLETYLLSNMKFDTLDKDIHAKTIKLGGNYLHCDCSTARDFRVWLIARKTFIPDHDEIYCDSMNLKVLDLKPEKICLTPQDWTDYINYIITAEILLLFGLIAKVSYDYWVFKTAGYLPWPASKMPKLPCDWLCE